MLKLTLVSGRYIKKELLQHCCLLLLQRNGKNREITINGSQDDSVKRGLCDDQIIGFLAIVLQRSF